MEGDMVRAGEECLAQVRLQQPLVAGPGDRFIMRLDSPPLTVGGGRVIEAAKGRLKRTRPAVLEDLRERARAVTSDRDFAEYCLKTAESSALEEADLSTRTKTRPARLKEILRELMEAGRVIEVGKSIYMHHDAARLMEQRILQTLGDFHRASPESPGMTSTQLIESLKTDKTVLAHAVNSLKQQGKLVERNQRLALAEHREEYSEEERKQMDAVEALFRRGLFHPPGIAEIAGELRIDTGTIERVLRILIEHERVVPVAEDLLFHREAIDRARQILTEFILKEGELESVKFKYLLDTTRKFAIPLLDYFDRIGVTLRRGNTRYLKSSAGEKPI
jgi:selenocysteine-specific elongation factor